MAVYFLRARHISRGKGGRVTRAAAYRAGERILDQRTSETHDFSDRRDIPYKEVVLPADLTAGPIWRGPRIARPFGTRPNMPGCAAIPVSPANGSSSFLRS
jgi:hypothetical protein